MLNTSHYQTSSIPEFRISAAIAEVRRMITHRVGGTSCSCSRFVVHQQMFTIDWRGQCHCHMDNLKGTISNLESERERE